MPADFVHRFTPATAAGYPFTLVLLQGTGGDERDLEPLAQALAPGAAMLGVRGKVVSVGRILQLPTS